MFNEAAALVPPELIPEVVALTAVLYTEARGEPLVGVLAVADTVRNRVASSMFPGTYFQVCTQPHQFSGMTEGILIQDNIDRDVSDDLLAKLVSIAAGTVTNNRDSVVKDTLFYHTIAVSPYWTKRYNKVVVVGNHVFYTTTKL